MCKNPFIVVFLVIVIALTSSIQLYAQNKGVQPVDSQTKNDTVDKDKYVDFVLRYGQGGFSDSRSPEGKLGGGQITLDIKPHAYPVALSLSTEFYTNSPEPTHPYEIEDLNVVNLLYYNQLFDFERAHYFVGGGIGRIEVPKDERDSVKGMVYDLEAGMNVEIYWNIGLYGVAKYIYAEKTVDNVQVIDFNEGIILVGLCVFISL